MWAPDVLLLVGATLFVAGLVKGVVGMGLPLVGLAVLTATLGLQPAMALMLVPAFVSNVWQGAVGGALTTILRRFWPMLLAAVAGVWLGVAILARADPALMSALLGLVISAYAAWGLLVRRVPRPGGERWLKPMIGGVNGVITGMTGVYVFPSVPYMQALGVARDTLVQAMGVMFTVCTLALAAALASNALIPDEAGLLSVAAVAPTLAGMAVGQRLRRRLSETAFRRLLLLALLAIGSYLLIEWLVAGARVGDAL